MRRVMVVNNNKTKGVDYCHVHLFTTDICQIVVNVLCYKDAFVIGMSRWKGDTHYFKSGLTLIILYDGES